MAFLFIFFYQKSIYVFFFDILRTISKNFKVFVEFSLWLKKINSHNKKKIRITKMDVWILRIFGTIIKVATEHQYWPKIGQNSIISFFCLKKALEEGQSPPQELEVGLCSWPSSNIKISVTNRSCGCKSRQKKIIFILI